MMQQRILQDSDIRFLAVSMINAETERDRQQEIGASSLSNPCDKCLAADFMGVEWGVAFADRPFLGASLGTLFHMGLQERLPVAQGIYPGAEAEQKVACCVIPGYGVVPGHFDLQPTAWHIVDWKGSDRTKIALLEDYMQSINRHRVGLAPRWEKQRDTKAGEGGRKFKLDAETVVTYSARKYREEMASMGLKYLSYFGQQNLYMHAKGAKRASLVMIARDGTGYFDNPEYGGYDDEERKHDIFVVSFPYDQAYTLALIQRGTDIWSAIQGGADLSAFAPHEDCYVCKKAADKHIGGPEIEYAGLDEPAMIAPGVATHADGTQTSSEIAA